MYKEIQSGAVAKSHMRKSFLIYEEMRKYFPIYDFATASFWISSYMSKIWFSFLSVYVVPLGIPYTWWSVMVCCWKHGYIADAWESALICEMCEETLHDR